MKQIKCPVCGGQLEASRSGMKMTCLFCDAVFDTADEVQEKENNDKELAFDPEMFIVEKRIEEELESGKNEMTADCLRTIIFCLREFETPEDIEKYMRKYIGGSSLAAPGINGDMIEKVMPRVSSEMDTDEKVVLYYDRGIMFKCKEFMMMTNKRIFFVNKKKCLYVLHEDIDKMELDCDGDFPMWEINGDYQRTIPSVNNGTVQGAAIAYSCLCGFRKDPGRQRIKLF